VNLLDSIPDEAIEQLEDEQQQEDDHDDGDHDEDDHCGSAVRNLPF
jgi:hypothetical protein